MHAASANFATSRPISWHRIFAMLPNSAFLLSASNSKESLCGERAPQRLSELAGNCYFVAVTDIFPQQPHRQTWLRLFLKAYGPENNFSLILKPRCHGDVPIRCREDKERTSRSFKGDHSKCQRAGLDAAAHPSRSKHLKIRQRVWNIVLYNMTVFLKVVSCQGPPN